MREKRWLLVMVCILFVTSFAAAQDGFRGRPITNNISMPTGYCLNKGEFLVGIGPIGFGVTDQVQVGTNILLWLFQDYNANVKISFIKTKTMAFAAGLRIDYLNLKVTGADQGFTFLSPYVVISPRIGSKTILHVAGKYSYITGNGEIEDAEVEQTASGTRIFGGLEHGFSNRTKFLAEVGYDFTFDGITIGGAVMFGWKNFRLKLGVQYYNPEGTSGFTLPAVGLWWRFQG